MINNIVSVIIFFIYLSQNIIGWISVCAPHDIS